MATHEDLVITDDWRRAVCDRLEAKGWSRNALARAVKTSSVTILMVLSGKQKTSGFVPAINRVLEMHEAPRATPPLPVPDPEILAVSELRAARDAIHEDIIRLEFAQATIAERLAEAYQARAELDVEIREQRGARHDPRNLPR
jgi:transcriptional regulator with XRE-family HTH domain